MELKKILLASVCLLTFPLSSHAIVITVSATSELDPAGGGSITSTTTDANNFEDAVAYQSRIDTAFSSGLGGVVFNSNSTGGVEGYDVNYDSGNKLLDVNLDPDRNAWFGTVGSLESNDVELFTLADNEFTTLDFTNPGNLLVETAGLTIINRNGSAGTQGISITATFGDASTLTLTDTIESTASSNELGVFFSFDGRTNGGIDTIAISNTSGGRGFGVDGLGFTVIPEPSSLSLILGGLALLFFRRRARG